MNVALRLSNNLGDGPEMSDHRCSRCIRHNIECTYEPINVSKPVIWRHVSHWHVLRRGRRARGAPLVRFALSRHWTPDATRSLTVIPSYVQVLENRLQHMEKLFQEV